MDIATTQTIPDGYKLTEVGVIPIDWAVTLLPEVLYFISGKAHEKYIVDDGKFISVNSKFISSDGTVAKYSDKNFCPAREDDILMVMSDLPNGKALSKCFFVDLNNRYAVNQRVCILRAKAGYPKYFYYTLNRNRYFLQYDDGVQQTHLLVNVFKKCPVIVPSNQEEQKSIATVLSDLDSLIQKTEKLVAKKKAIKQGAMHELLTGKRRLPGFGGDWETNKLENIAEYRRGSFPQPYGLEKWYDDNFGKPFVQVFDVDDNFKLKADTKRKISKAGESLSVFAKKGTIILTIQGSIGRICITQYDTFVDRTLLIFESFKKDFDKYFLMLQLFLKFEIEKEKAPGGIIKTITKEALSDFEIRYPKDKKEQSSVAKVILDMNNQIEILERKLSKYIDIKQGAMQVLLTGKIRLIKN